MNEFIDWNSLPFKRQTGKEKIRCPKCDDIRTDKRDKSLQVNHDDGFGKCHYCDALTFREDNQYGKTNKVYTEIKPEPQDKKYSDKFLKWIESERGLKEDTLRSMHITEEMQYQPKRGKEVNNVVFNYYEGSKLVNKKFRSGGKDFTAVSGGKPILYNINSAIGADELWIVEGEFDALVLKQKGINNVVSLPNGANDSDEYWSNSEKYIKHINSFIIAVDNDEKGHEIREKIAQRLGRYRCKYIEWKNKDANDDLLDGSLEESLRSAKRFPVGGTHSIEDLYDSLLGLYENGLPKTISPKKECFGKLPEVFTIMRGHLVTGTGIPSHGKALDVNTPIPTPDGFVKMGDLKIGDSVFDENGNVCSVKWVSQVWEDRPTYKLTFSDNSTIICDENHEWLTDDWKSRRSYYNAKKNKRDKGRKVKKNGNDQTHKRTFAKVRETKEIVETIKTKSDNRNNHSVNICSPIKCKSKNLAIHPYVLGAWLGDGYSSSGGFSSADDELIERLMSLGYEVSKSKAKYSYHIKNIVALLREMGLLFNKHIPNNYLFSSEQDRMELLRGLMDTDGHCSIVEGRNEYCGINKELVRGVYKLVCSLGIKATFVEGEAVLNGRVVGPKYRVFFKTNKKVYSLKRKQKVIDEYFEKRKTRGNNVRYITKAERVYGYKTKCIEVDSSSHLFLAGENFIPTHNSSFTDWYILNLIQEYDMKASLFSPEHSPMELHLSKYASLAVGKPFFKNQSRLTKQDLSRFKDWANEKIYFTSSEDGDFPTWSWIFEKFKEQVFAYGIDIFVIDAFNKVVMDKGQEGKAGIDAVLTKLTMFAQIHNVIIFLIAHPTKMKKSEDGLYEIPTLYDVSGSADFRNQTHDGFTIYRYFETQERGGYNIFVNQKTKFDFQGKIGEQVEFEYHMDTGRYFASGYPEYLDDMTIPKQKEQETLELKTEYAQPISKENADFPAHPFGDDDDEDEIF